MNCRLSNESSESRLGGMAMVEIDGNGGGRAIISLLFNVLNFPDCGLSYSELKTEGSTPYVMLIRLRK